MDELKSKGVSDNRKFGISDKMAFVYQFELAIDLVPPPTLVACFIHCLINTSQ